MQNTKRVFTDKKDFPLSTIREMFDDGDIIPQPDYQREFVYDEKRISKLIESALIGIPIPIVYLCEEQDNTYTIIDGQQRITSFVKFLKNEVALKGLEEFAELNGKKFCDLNKADQKKLKNVTLSSIILTKESQELKYEIFARLNQGAVKLKPQELRNCVYRGPLNTLLEKIAKKPFLQSLFLEENKRKNYQEYILRFFALRHYDDYGSSMAKTMNNYMAMHQNANADEIEALEKKFMNTMDIIKQVLGHTAFCAYDRQNNRFINKFSGSIYDSIAIAFSFFNSHDLIAHADQIRKEIEEIKMKDQEYQDYTYAATGSKDRVVGRIMKIRTLLSNILGKNTDISGPRIFDADVKEALWHEGYICPYCNQTIIDKEDAEIDHIIPFSKGGKTDISNAQLLHRHCNREKNNSVDDALETIWE